MSDPRPCPNCRAEVGEAASFCPRCGQRLEVREEPAPPPAAVPAPPPPPVTDKAPPAAAPPPPSPAVPFVRPSTPARRSSPWPAILIGCGVLFLLGLATVGFLVYKGYMTVKAVQHEVMTETSKTTATGGGSAADKTTDGTGTEGSGTGEGTPSEERRPVIQVDESADPSHPPTAYAVEEVPPLDVKEGQKFGEVTTGDQAAGLVLAMPDVQTWVAAIKQARDEGKKRTAMVTVELIPGSGNYLVHLFENVQDEEPGHTATFGWFKVNQETGAVSNETMDSD